jgi:hypothetical protein
MSEIHSPDIIGLLRLANNAGATGDLIVSQGPGSPPLWVAPTAAVKRQFMMTSKATQIIAAGPADITWNAPAADSFFGVTYNAPGTFTLPANRTFFCEALVMPTTGNSINIAWVDSANVLIGSVNVPATGSNANVHLHATAVVRVLVPTIIKVRLTSALGVTISQESYVFIRATD